MDIDVFDDIVNAIEDIGNDKEYKSNKGEKVESRSNTRDEVDVDVGKDIESRSSKREQVGDKYVDILYIIVDKFHNSLTYTDIEEAFYKALYKALSTCTDENTFNAYLYKIATNECLYEYRRQHRHEILSYDAEDTLISEFTSSKEVDLDIKECLNDIKNYIPTLPKQVSEIMNLLIQDVQPKQITEHLHVAMSSVSRAKKIFSQRFLADFPEYVELINSI